MAWLYKHLLHGVYFRIQGHKICQWLPCRNSPWGHFILRSNAFNFQGFHDNEPNVLWWWRAACIPDIPESFYFCIYIFKKWESYVVCSVYGNQTPKGGGKTGRGKEKWVWKSIWELLLANTLPFCQLVRRWYHSAERKPDHSSIMALNGYFSLWDFKGYFIVQHVFWILEIKQRKDSFHSQILWWELTFQGSVDAWLLKRPLWRGQKHAVLHCSSVQPLPCTKFTRRCITPVRISDHKIM